MDFFGVNVEPLGPRLHLSPGEIPGNRVLKRLPLLSAERPLPHRALLRKSFISFVAPSRTCTTPAPGIMAGNLTGSGYRELPTLSEVRATVNQEASGVEGDPARRGAAHQHPRL